MTKLSTRLKNARVGLNLSQDYVAKQLKINRTSIVQIESGKRKVSTDELVKFSSIYGYSSDELLHGNDTKLPEISFARSFSDLDPNDQKEILSMIEFKKMIKGQRIVDD